MIRIAVALGTRPEIIKMASVIKSFQKSRGIQLVIIHTGQHYDWYMSQAFLGELGLPHPTVYLNVRSGPNQFGNIVLRATRALARICPDVVLVEGDTNSAAGVALASTKLAIPVGHVEAGCRSFDRNMQEEINRLLIADCANANFAPTRTCKENLLRENVEPNIVYLTGHPIVETLNDMRPRIKRSTVIQSMRLKPRRFALLTLHRAETVDNADALSNVVSSLKATQLPIVFPVHPRTKSRLRQFRLLGKLRSMKIRMVQPCKYVPTLRLIADSRLVLTDSGGIQQECALLKTPCVTLRDTTEWTETLKAGVNFLAPPFSPHLESTIRKVSTSSAEIRKRFPRKVRFFGDDQASRRIMRIVKSNMVACEA